MSYECATVMHPHTGTELWWGSLADGRFIFVESQTFKNAPLRYRWSPQWWMRRLERDGGDPWLGDHVWVEDVNGRVLQREVIFT